MQGRVILPTAAWFGMFAMAALFRYTSTGILECASTFCVALPSSRGGRRPAPARAAGGRMAGPVLFQTLQPLTHDEIHATVQRAVAALMAAYGPVKA